MILLFEGYDGSGKTTLIENFCNYLKNNNKSVLLISRDYNTPINTITSIIKDKESKINPTSEVLLRLARERERIHILEQEKENYDFIIFDRSIISATSWVKHYNLNAEIFDPIKHDLFSVIGECYLVYCYLPFDNTWERINSREKELSKKEQMGKEANQKMYSSLRDTFLDFELPNVQKTEINSLDSRDMCLSNLITSLGLN